MKTKQGRVQSNKKIPESEKYESEVQLDNVQQSEKHDEVNDELKENLQKSENPTEKMLVLPWWMRIIIQNKNKLQ